MGYGKGETSLSRQDAVSMDELVTQLIREMKLAGGLTRQRAAEVWNEVSGAGRYTLDVMFDRGVMTCVISSSVVRNQLYFHRTELLRRLNERLSEDSLFTAGKDGLIVRNLILR